MIVNQIRKKPRQSTSADAEIESQEVGSPGNPYRGVLRPHPLLLHSVLLLTTSPTIQGLPYISRVAFYPDPPQAPEEETFPFYVHSGIYKWISREVV